MKKIILLFFSILTIALPVSIACNCGGGGTFCEGITNSEGEIYESLVIVRGTITSKNEEGMNVEIQHNLFGDLNQDEIYVRQGYGINCSMGLMILRKIRNTFFPYGKKMMMYFP